MCRSGSGILLTLLPCSCSTDFQPSSGLQRALPIWCRSPGLYPAGLGFNNGFGIYDQRFNAFPLGYRGVLGYNGLLGGFNGLYGLRK
ncbi:hypothetical protein CDAR_365831 [Caerostris darwini]|uniref:Uncharacterized protein n=1 Tax=Caerostris darwini TaxID=1538125 RepID=A0AAV4MRF5_9ARAC|nr:hypothetical protein CDAR_365831 [Caerostris darwini]